MVSVKIKPHQYTLSQRSPCDKALIESAKRQHEPAPKNNSQQSEGLNGVNPCLYDQENEGMVIKKVGNLYVMS